MAAQEEAQEMAAAEALAREAAEKARRKATVNELVAFARNELENPSDVSYSLALLLAKQAVLTMMESGEPASPGAEDVLRQAIDAAPISNIGLSEVILDQLRFAAWSPDGLR